VEHAVERQALVTSRKRRSSAPSGGAKPNAPTLFHVKHQRQAPVHSLALSNYGILSAESRETRFEI
jgi:hypothetical protein